MSEPTFDRTQIPSFADAYWNSFPAPVRALRNISDDVARYEAAVTLAKQGFPIDVEIMVNGATPYLEQWQRLVDGFTWVPNAMQPRIGFSEGINNPPYVPYDPANPPVGSLKVSVNPSDYPPNADIPPPNPPPVQSTNLVGVPMMVGGFALSGTAATELKSGAIFNGFKLVENGHSYTLVVGQGLMGPSAYWEQTS